jgi:hypothetical protein
VQIAFEGDRIPDRDMKLLDAYPPTHVLDRPRAPGLICEP